MNILLFGASTLYPLLVRRFGTGRKRTRTIVVALTGGPCGGKSTTLKFLKEKLHERGYSDDVFIVPEVPTLLMEGGVLYPGRDAEDRLLNFEVGLIQTQIAMEKCFINHATLSSSSVNTAKPKIIICDRATVDIKAYMDNALWEQVLNVIDKSENELLLSYDCVLHMVTAADGAEKYFGNDTNHIRLETIEEAREQDNRTRAAWISHPNVHIIDNSTDFRRKQERVFDALLSSLSLCPATSNS
jgi:thymidylate kinase